MKKISITFSLLAIILFAACQSSKKTATTVAAPVSTKEQKAGLPQKGMMTEESTTKVTPMNEVAVEKKILPKSKMKAMEMAPITIDTPK